MAASSGDHSKLDLFYSRSQCYISTFFIISPRGSTILTKDLRGDLPYRNCVEIFWQNIKREEQQFETSSLIKSRDINQNGNYEPSSFFNIDNITYIYHKNIHNIYYLMITKCNISPSFAIESLHKLIQSFCDYCGRRSMTEQAIRDNFILLYELVDEYYDNGYIQIPSVNDLLNLNVIYNQPTLDNLSEIWNLLLTADLIASHTEGNRHRSHNTAISSFAPPPHPTSTIIESPDKNQIFVDIVEYINVTSQSFYYRRNHLSCDHNSNPLQFNQTPIVQTSSIHGSITMKVFLSNISAIIAPPKKKKKRRRKRKKLKFGKKNREEKEKEKEEQSVSQSPPPTLQQNAMEYLCSLAPGIRLQFNDDLIIGRENAPPYNKIFGALILDDVSFHKKILSSQCQIEEIIHEKEKFVGTGQKNEINAKKNVNISFMDNFAKKKILKFFLPNGEEFDIMSYRITSSFRDGSRSRPSSRRNSPKSDEKKRTFSYNLNNLKNGYNSHMNGQPDENYTDYLRIPFRILPYFNVIHENQYQKVPTIEFLLKIRADFPRQCIGRDIIVEYNVPNCVSTVSLQTKTGNKTQQTQQNNLKQSGNGAKSEKNGSKKSKSKSKEWKLSEKELSLIKQSAECITMVKSANTFSSAFNIDLTSKYSLNVQQENESNTNININKKRQLNPARPSRKVIWRINKFPAGVEQVLKCKFTLNYHHEMTETLLCKSEENKMNNCDNFDLFKFRKIVSPIAMKFQIDNYNVSGLDIRSLRCIDWTSQRDDGGSNNGLYTTYRPYRWVRRITKSASYVCRL